MKPNEQPNEHAHPNQFALLKPRRFAPFFWTQFLGAGHDNLFMPLLGWFFRLAKAIPIAPQREDPVAYEQAFIRAREVLNNGELRCLFPEGALTRDGELGEFKGGVMKLLETNPVPSHLLAS